MLTTSTKRSPKQALFKLAITLISIFTLFTSSGCSNDESVTLGFVGGLTGRVSDLGGPARNGMLLAIEEANQKGGIRGNPIHFIIKDDKQDKDKAIKAVTELLEAKVDAIIGPVTSSMAVNVAPLATQAKTLMMGVTVTTNDLSGKDDFFVRCLAPTQAHAREVANFLFNKKNIRSFSAVYDLKNKAYSHGWLKDFQQAIESLGGSTKKVLNFSSGKPEELIPIAKDLVLDQPDIVIFVTNAVDAALLAKLVRSESPEVLLGTSEWAGTERLIELGGKFIEGAYVPQYLDRESQDPEYIKFRNRFVERFDHEPGFPGLIAYNATNVVINRLELKNENETLKESILNERIFPGIQGQIQFDEFGDVKSKTYVTQVQNGRFVVQK